MAGGSNAHGDLNYRRKGTPCLSRWCDAPVSDTALGKPRNLVRVSQPPTDGRYSNRQVIDALRTGEFSVTDGPALRVVMDRNANGKVDDSDLQMGSTFDIYPGEHAPLLVEWKSTPEFGAVREIDIYVGTTAATFAPSPHGPEGAPTGATGAAYKPDPSGVLKIRPTVATEIQGVARLFLTPSQFRLVAAGGPLFYVRAYAITGASTFTGFCPAGERCTNRQAFTNPLWGRYNARCPGVGTDAPPTATTGTTSTTGAVGATNAGVTGTFGTTPTFDSGRPHHGSSRDQDGNDVPDPCERLIPDPCSQGSSPASGFVDVGVLSGVATANTGVGAIPPTITTGIGVTGPASKTPPPRSCQIMVAPPLPPVTGTLAPGLPLP